MTSNPVFELSDIFEEIEEMAAVFIAGVLADDLNADREEYITSHIDLLRTLNPGILGMTYRRMGAKELVILRYENRILPVNITRMTDEEATRALMDYAWGCQEGVWNCVTEVNYRHEADDQSNRKEIREETHVFL